MFQTSSQKHCIFPLGRSHKSSMYYHSHWAVTSVLDCRNHVLLIGGHNWGNPPSTHLSEVGFQRHFSEKPEVSPFPRIIDVATSPGVTHALSSLRLRVCAVLCRQDVLSVRWIKLPMNVRFIIEKNTDSPEVSLKWDLVIKVIHEYSLDTQTDLESLMGKTAVPASLCPSSSLCPQAAAPSSSREFFSPFLQFSKQEVRAAISWFASFRHYLGV